MSDQKQPEALRLADWLDALDVRSPDRIQNCVSAAAELRRLHEVNQELLNALRLMQIDCQYLHHAKKDRHQLCEPCPVEMRVCGAIAKAEREQK